MKDVDKKAYQLIAERLSNSGKDIDLIKNASKGRPTVLSEGLSDKPDITHGGATIFTLDVERYEEL